MESMYSENQWDVNKPDGIIWEGTNFVLFCCLLFVCICFVLFFFWRFSFVLF